MNRLSVRKLFGLLLAMVFVFNTTATGTGAGLSAPEDPPAVESMEVTTPIFVYYDPTVNAPFQIPAPESYTQMSRLGVQSADIHVNFLPNGTVNDFGYTCLTWPSEAMTAFEYAAGIWETLVNSSVTIEVDACWTTFSDPLILGGAGADGYYSNFTGAPLANTFYPTALANALYGGRVPPAAQNTTDINAAFSSEYTWYYGTDGSTPAGQMDFVTVVLHELCHGLGFMGAMGVNGGYGYWGVYVYDDGPMSYDHFTETGTGTPLLSLGNGTTALGSALVSEDVFFDGPYATAANGGTPPELYVPPAWASGSSYSHLDESYNNTADDLMTWSIPDAHAVHTPGSVILGVLQDVGWTMPAANTAPVLAGIPDQVVPMNQSRDNAIDLWQYAQDAEDADNTLTFSLAWTPPVSAGITIDSNRYIDINPAVDYTGVVSAEVQVQDPGGLTGSDIFNITITDENFPPTLSIPDMRIAPNSSATYNLWTYADDLNDGDAALVFTVESVSTLSVTVSITGDHFLNVTPETDWMGTAAIGVRVTDPGALSVLDSFDVNVSEGESIYLPLIARMWPPIPGAVTLQGIANSSGSGSYTVQWTTADRATTYELQEDDNAGFSSPTTAYSGSGTSWSASGKSAGTYYYRVRGQNAYASGAWSNVQSTLVYPTQTEFESSADSFILSTQAGTNFGSYTGLSVGYNYAGCNNGLPEGVARSLIRYDLSSIPAGVPIASATLNLYLGGWCTYEGHTQARAVLIHRVASDWTEAGVTWNTAPVLAEGQTSGSVAPTGEAWYSFDVTALVQGWVNGSLPNYGLYVIGPEVSGSEFAFFIFGAYESGYSYSPYLDITYAGATQQAAEIRAKGIPASLRGGGFWDVVRSGTPFASTGEVNVLPFSMCTR